MENKIINGDCLSILNDLKPKSVHAVVTDAPYNYEGGIMQNEWDNIGTPKEYQLWCESWASKCLDILKPGGHIIAFSGDRSHHRLMSGLEDAGFEIRHTIPWIYGTGFPKGQKLERWLDEEYVEEFGDWRSLLKPAVEFAILARKDVEGSATKNQMKYGVGNLNVEACRIEGKKPNRLITTNENADSLNYGENTFQKTSGMAKGISEEGRFPANLILDSVMAEVIDGMSPVSDIEGEDIGASRFFYCSKASKSEKTHNGNVDNDHNSVKPLDVMEWLIKMVTAEEQIVLDPFAGSGTTLVACKENNRKYIGIEKDKEYVEIAKKRLEHT